MCLVFLPEFREKNLSSSPIPCIMPSTNQGSWISTVAMRISASVLAQMAEFLLLWCNFIYYTVSYLLQMWIISRWQTCTPFMVSQMARHIFSHVIKNRVSEYNFHVTFQQELTSASDITIKTCYCKNVQCWWHSSRSKIRMLNRRIVESPERIFLETRLWIFTTFIWWPKENHKK